jgi:hypothetical protein
MRTVAAVMNLFGFLDIWERVVRPDVISYGWEQM